MKTCLKRLLLFLISSIIAGTSYAQPKTNLVGLNLTAETSSGSFRPAGGIVLERQLTRNSGIETGLYYRNFIRYGTIQYTDSILQTHTWGISEHYVSVPVLFKFYSRIINLSAGSVLDFYAGWRQRESASSITLEDYDVDPNLFVGFLIKASKTISLSERLVLEPEIRFHPLPKFNTYRTGIGIAGKCRL